MGVMWMALRTWDRWRYHGTYYKAYQWKLEIAFMIASTQKAYNKQLFCQNKSN